MRVLSVVGCLLSVALTRAQESHVPLHDGWTFCQAGKEQWYTAEVPGVVQTDLLRHGLIPEFYKGSNIDSVQWVENEDWIYKRTIVANDSLLKHGHVDLVFKGLDTFAEVYLNDSLLGKADNMFRTWEWPIKEALKPGANELKVIFRSPIKEGAKLREAYGIQLPHDNDPSGVSPYIRKAAYQFGWDFCPRLVTSGIWQRVELRCWSKARFDVVKPSIWWAPESFIVGVDADIVNDSAFVGKVEAYLNGVRISSEPVKFNGAEVHREFRYRLKDIRTWWPAGMGERPFYDLEIRLSTKQGNVITSLIRRLAYRTIRLVQRVDTVGTSFAFVVNGEPFFARGCNLVPPSMFPSQVRDQDWVHLVKDMQAAHMSMVRVWAGGIYPPEAFYNACDTAGILVWQDLMIANIPPDDEHFVKNVRAEVREQVRQLKAHPSLALVCGDNELDVAWKNWGWQNKYGIHKADSVRIAKEYGGLFPVLQHDIGWDIPSIASSPLSNWGTARGLRSGDLHFWGVWHGDHWFASFANNVGRFVSEYGFQSYPDSVLLSHYVDPKELYLGSPAMKRMQRSYKTDKPIWDAITRELGKEPKTLGEFIEDSQEVQAKAYRMAIEAHTAAQPHCMGTLFWQLNDCWPGPSWSLIDFEGNWKPGMYEVQKLYGR